MSVALMAILCKCCYCIQLQLMMTFFRRVPFFSFTHMTDRLLSRELGRMRANVFRCPLPLEWTFIRTHANSPHRLAATKHGERKETARRWDESAGEQLANEVHWQMTYREIQFHFLIRKMVTLAIRAEMTPMHKAATHDYSNRNWKWEHVFS